VSLLDQVHQILGPLAKDDLLRLQSSIEQDGAVVPIIIHASSGEIIDGRHRAQLTNDYRVINLDVDEREAVCLAVRLNLARRHLSLERKQELIKLLRPLFTQQELARMIGTAQSRVSELQNISNIDSDNAYIPDLRYKIKPQQEEEIVKRLDEGETQAQVAADFGISQSRVGQIQKKLKKYSSLKAQREAETHLKSHNILVGDMSSLGSTVPDSSIDLIFTDPPYGKENLSQYEELASFAARALKPGGSLLCYSGQSTLPEVFTAIQPYLNYHWALCTQHTGQIQRLPGYRLFIHWKPILWFTKGPERFRKQYVADLVLSKQSKKHHRWEQGIEEAAYYIEALTLPRELVCDPFCGSGTTCLAAKRLGRHYLAFEIDPKTADVARKRVADG